MLKPILSTISPVQGEPGTRLVIVGANFTDTSEVFFSDVEATESVVSGREIRTVVPQGAPTLSYVKVRNGELDSNKLTFSVREKFQSPIIREISPKEVRPNQNINIFGSNFSPGIRAYIGNELIDTDGVTESVVIAEIPNWEITEETETTISLKDTKGRGSRNIPLRLLPPIPVIRMIESSESKLTIKGQHFLPGSIVLINSKPLETTFVSEKELTTSIPPLTESVSVQVENPNKQVSLTRTWKTEITTPKITGIDKTLAKRGETIIVRGYNFMPGLKIFFGNRMAIEYQIETLNKIKVKIPAITPGIVKVKITSFNGIESNPINLQVEA